MMICLICASPEKSSAIWNVGLAIQRAGALDVTRGEIDQMLVLLRAAIEASELLE
jgi:hypothetical protein